MKNSLLAARTNLSRTKKGHDLLEIKYAAFLRELKREENVAKEMQDKLTAIEAVAQRARLEAEVEMGELRVNEILETVQWDEWQIIPTDKPENSENIGSSEKPKKPPYDLHITCAALDEAFFAWAQLQSLQKKLAEVTAKIEKLTANANRTKKRISALKNILIPKHEQEIIYFSNKIEENERDEMVRRDVAMKA